MRRVVVMIPLLLLFGCRGTQPYTRIDLKQVRAAYAEIPPIYRGFKTAYFAGDKTGILTYYRREQKACRLVDVVDRRDTIDPNTNLFAVSAGLDSLCNDIERAYVGWATVKGYPHDMSITPGRPQDVFVDGDANLEKMPKQIIHPAAFA